ncbi:hypothetical protein ACF1G5_23930 [Streptomyces coeruleorubidus]|uniref:hypothetical protein n=1 Tax=Streptomyces coeruleorubidus TaxID=116188 RepID=UPI0036F9C2FF
MRTHIRRAACLALADAALAPSSVSAHAQERAPASAADRQQVHYTDLGPMGYR